MPSYLSILVLAASASGASVTVTKPVSTDTWIKGQAYQITWTVSGQMPNLVRISLRDKTTNAEVKLIGDNAPNTGSFQWTIPASISDDQYRVRVKVKDAAIQDDSDLFAIAASAPPAASIVVTKPASPDKWDKNKTYAITWTKNGTMPNTVKISLMDKNSVAVVKEIADGVANSGSHSWLVPSDLAFGDYRVRVLVKTTQITDDSDTFSIAVVSMPQGTAAVEQKTGITSQQATAEANWTEVHKKAVIQNWSGFLPHFADLSWPPQSAYVGYQGSFPQNTDPNAYAHVGYDYHSFLWEGTDVTGWLAVCWRAKVVFSIGEFQGQEGKLISAKMRLKQIASNKVNCSYASCGTGLSVFLAPWTDW